MTRPSRYNEAAEGEMDYVASKINESAVRTSNRSQAELPKCLQSEVTGFLNEDISRNTSNAEHFAPDYYRDNNPNIRINTITFAPSAWANSAINRDRRLTSLVPKEKSTINSVIPKFIGEKKPSCIASSSSPTN